MAWDITQPIATDSLATSQSKIANNFSFIQTAFGSSTLTNGITKVQGDLFYASDAETIAKLAKNTTATRYLSNIGTSNNPSWAAVNVANGVTGVLPEANGGTNLVALSSITTQLSGVTNLSGLLSATSLGAVGTLASVNIDGGTIDGTVIGGSATASATFTGISVAGLTATADLDIGTYEMRANTLESDVATGTAPLVIASTTKVTNLNADLLDGSSASTTTGSAVIPIADASGYLPDNSVDTTALKTATSEVSTTTNAVLTLTGGTYGFYPQTKMSGTDSGDWSSTMMGRYGANYAGFTTYATSITLFTTVGGATIYAQNRYVTASGEDLWVWLLVDKNTKEIISAVAAEDHPAYGNGGDFNKMPHPFGSYDNTIQEIVLLDKETCLTLKQENEQTGKSILTLVNEEYKPNMTKEETYQPLHSGKFIDKKPELVQSIPDYIKIRKLVKLNEQEKQQKKNKIEQDTQKAKQDKIAKENKIKIKLQLTDSELQELKEILR